MLKTVKTYSCLAVVCALAVLPIGVFAGGTPEEVKAFKENKAKAEAGEGFPDNYSPFDGPRLDVTGKAISADSPTPGALVANAYLSGVGVDRDESEALLWYLRVRGQKGLNEMAFKEFIKSMPGNQLYGVIRRSRSDEFENFRRQFKVVPIEVDKVFRPLSDLRSSSRAEGNFAFGGDDFGGFLFHTAWYRSKRLILEQFNGFSASDANMAAPHVLSSVSNLMYDKFRFEDLSIDISFSPSVIDSDKAVFGAASSRIKETIDTSISNPGAADSGRLHMVADAYAEGRFGLGADSGQHKRWENLASEARIAEAKLRREEADSSGPEVWLQLAEEIKWASPDVKNILSNGRDWASNYVEVLSMKAEAGDRGSIDGLIAYYGQIIHDGYAGMPGQGKGIREATYERDQLIRWVSERHKLSNTPEDAIILAHHYLAKGQADLAKRMANQYLFDLTRKAKEGSLQDMLRVALLSDPNWYENLESGLGSYSPSEIRSLHRTPKHNEFYPFGDHGQLLKSFGSVGPIVLSLMEEGSATNPFNNPGFAAYSAPVQLSPRSLFVRYVDAFVKMESSGGPLLEYLQDYANLTTVLRYLAEQDQLTADKYREVKGGARDYDVSLRWHRMLLEMGDYSAVMFFAESFEQGRGMPRDPTSAYAYYSLAGSGPGNGSFPNAMHVTFQNTRGTNEQKLDACFKLTPVEKARALTTYNDFVAKLIARLERLTTKGAEQMAKRDLQAIRDYQAQKAGKAKAVKK